MLEIDIINSGLQGGMHVDVDERERCKTMNRESKEWWEREQEEKRKKAATMEVMEGVAKLLAKRKKQLQEERNESSGMHRKSGEFYKEKHLTKKSWLEHSHRGAGR